MTPGLPLHNRQNVGLRNTVFPRELVTRLALTMAKTNGLDGVCRELRFVVPFTPPYDLRVLPGSVAVAECGIGASLVNFIPRVIERDPKKQVIRITAGWVIASMENMQTIRYRPLPQKPRQTMGPDYLALEPNGPVSSVVTVARPYPTFPGLIKLFFKPLQRCPGASTVTALVSVQKPVESGPGFVKSCRLATATFTRRSFYWAVTPVLMATDEAGVLPLIAAEANRPPAATLASGSIAVGWGDAVDPVASDKAVISSPRGVVLHGLPATTFANRHLHRPVLPTVMAMEEAVALPLRGPRGTDPNGLPAAAFAKRRHSLKLHAHLHHASHHTDQVTPGDRDDSVEGRQLGPPTAVLIQVEASNVRPAPNINGVDIAFHHCGALLHDKDIALGDAILAEGVRLDGDQDGLGLRHRAHSFRTRKPENRPPKVLVSGHECATMPLACQSVTSTRWVSSRQGVLAPTGGVFFCSGAIFDECIISPPSSPCKLQEAA